MTSRVRAQVDARVRARWRKPAGSNAWSCFREPAGFVRSGDPGTLVLRSLSLSVGTARAAAWRGAASATGGLEAEHLADIVDLHPGIVVARLQRE